jgi:hypothetical protein
VTGDLLDDLPYTGHGSPAALVRTLHAFDTHDFDAIVPGHGRVRRGREHLRNVTALFESIVRQATEARAAGLDADAAVERADLSAFRDTFVTDPPSERYWGFFMTEAVRRAWDEAGPATRQPQVNTMRDAPSGPILRSVRKPAVERSQTHADRHRSPQVSAGGALYGRTRDRTRRHGGRVSRQ